MINRISFLLVAMATWQLGFAQSVYINGSTNACTGTTSTYTASCGECDSDAVMSWSTSTGVSIADPSSRTTDFTFNSSGTYIITATFYNDIIYLKKRNAKALVNPVVEASINVAVNAYPGPVSVSASENEIDLGGAVTLTATGASHYSWNGTGLQSTTGSSVTAIPTSIGVKTFQVSGHDGSYYCKRTASVDINVIDDSFTGTIGRNSGGNDCGNLTGGLTLSSYDGTVLRWERSYDHGATFSNVPASYYSNSDQSAINYIETVETQFRAEVEASDGRIAESEPYTVQQLGAIPGTASIESLQSNCSSASGELKLSGHLGDVQHWQRSHDGGANWETLASTALATIPFNQTENTMFRAVVKRGACPEVHSNQISVDLDVIDAGEISTASINVGCANITGTLSLGNYDGNIVYWQRSFNNGYWYEISNSGGMENLTVNQSQQVSFRAAVQKPGCVTEYSSPVSFEPLNPDAGNLTKSSLNIACGHSTGTLTLQNYTGEVFTWEKSSNGTNWTTITGATEVTYSFDVTSYTIFRARVKRETGNCTADYSSRYHARVSSHGGTAHAQVTGGCGAGSGNLYTNNRTGTVMYWEHSVNEVDWATITGSEDQSYLPYSTVDPLNYYRAVVQLGSCPVAYSVPAVVTVDPPTQPGTVRLTEEPPSDIIGGKLTFHATFGLFNSSGEVERWQKESDHEIDYLQNTTTELQLDIVQTTGVRAEVKNGNCDALLSGQAIFVVNPEYLGVEDVVLGRQLLEYEGYSYQIADANGGVEMRDGFTFHGNSGQSFFVLIDDNYSYPQTEQNYLLEETILEEGLSEDDIYFANADQRSSQYTYFDGLGRAVQKVQRRASPGQNDLVIPIEYDQMGRVPVDYLPYISISDNGYYQPDALEDQAGFYADPPLKVAGSSNPYAVKVFEKSPLNRVMEQGAPGTEWQPGSGRAIKFKSLINAEGEAIRWEIDPATRMPIQNNTYEAGQLFMLVTVDEHQSKVKEFTNDQGKVVLKKVQNGTQWLQTYYIYNDVGLLRYVLQPEGVANLEGNPDQAFLDHWAFQNTYDDKRRLIIKKIPGGKMEAMIYDQYDRLMLFSDGNLLKRQDREGTPYITWQFIKYDEFNRPIITGTWVGKPDFPDGEIINGHHETWDDNAKKYTLGNTYPNDISESSLLSIIYYDDYGFLDNADWDAEGNNYDPGSGTAHFQSVKGQVTGSKVRELGGQNRWLNSVTYYDEKYRPIEVITENLLGIDRVTNSYSFSGELLESQLVHSTSQKDIAIANQYIYDHAGRMLAQMHQINGQPQVLLKQLQYNALGEMVEKNLHGTADGFVQSVDYRYNIRGWLTSINNSQLTVNNMNDDGDDLFGMELFYNQSLEVQGIGNAPAHNGNISAVKWRTFGGSPLAYTYQYDQVNRLKEANHYRNVGAWAAIDAFGVNNLSYDANGNILTLDRNNKYGRAMDALSYKYSGNMLLAVKDQSNVEAGFKDWYDKEVDNDYGYDYNGNMTEDKNKGITNIAYNHLNLPSMVDFGSGKYIEYIYDAMGIKLQQNVYEGQEVKTADYVGAFIYENNELQFIQHEEGRVVPTQTQTQFAYQYFLKDHLGNNRLVFTTEPKTYTFTATFESGNAVTEEEQFTNIAETRELQSRADANNDGGVEVVALNGNRPMGAGLTISVGTGDELDIEVYGYYEGGSGYSTQSALNTMIGAVAGGFGGATGATDAQQAIYDLFDNAISSVGLIGTSSDLVPAAFISYMLFDDNMVMYQYGYERISSAANGNHERIALEDITIDRSGIAYIWISNESASLDWVHFDDMEVTVNESKVVQIADFYPFGFQHEGGFNRVTAKENRFLYNGKEKDENTGWYDYGLRQYDSELGRWHVIDPSADSYLSQSPFNYSFNNPIRFIDPDGADPEDVLQAAESYLGTHYEMGGKRPVLITLILGADDYITDEWLADIIPAAAGAGGRNGADGNRRNIYESLGIGDVYSSGCSFGIDCSGLSANSFNADPDKLMEDLTGNAHDQMSAFANASKEGIGVLHDNFNNIGKGDVVFSNIKDGVAKHASVATGKVKTNKGNVKSVQVVTASGKGQRVKKKWQDAGKGTKIGHTFRKGDNVRNTYDQAGKKSRRDHFKRFRDKHQINVN